MTLKHCKYDILCLLTLLVSGIIYSYSVQHFVDLSFNDESNHLFSGLRGDYPPASWGIVYPYWYSLLSLSNMDPVELFYLNWRVLLIAVPTFFYGALRLQNVSILPSLLSAALLLFSFANIRGWPKNSHLSVVIILIGLMICSPIKRPWLRWIVMSEVFLMAAYVRPEFFSLCILSFIISLGLLLVDIFKSKRKMMPLLLTTGFTLTMAILLFQILGVPTEEGRLRMAFGQHFIINWNEWHQSHEYSFDQYDLILDKMFASPRAFYNIPLNNPDLFAKHLIENISRAPIVLAMDFRPYAFSAYNFAIGVGALTIFLIALAIARHVHHPSPKISLRHKIKSHLFFLSVTFMIALLNLASISIIFPRTHYVFIFGVFSALFLLVLLLAPSTSNLDRSKSTMALCILLLMYSFLAGAEEKEMPHLLPTVRFLQKLQSTTPLVLLENDGNYCDYLGSTCKWIHPSEKKAPLLVFLKQTNISVIVVSPWLIHEAHYGNDPDWQKFLMDPEINGFKKHPVAGKEASYLLIRDLEANENTPLNRTDRTAGSK